MIKQQILSNIFQNGVYDGKRWRKQEFASLKQEISNTLPKFELFTEKVWAILNDIEEYPSCPTCGKRVNFLGVTKGFTKTCSMKCSRNSLEWKDKVKTTTQERYGVDNVFQSKEIKARIQSTIIDRYGVEYSSQAETMQKKGKETRRNRYITNTLRERFQQLREQDIEPVDWKLEDYKNATIPYRFRHNICGNEYSGYFSSNGIPICPYCKSRSQVEQKLAIQLVDIFGTDRVKLNDRKLIAPREIDILVDDRLAIEVNGVYWHADGKGKLALQEKTKLSPVQMLHFWDYELEQKFEICLSVVLAKLGHFQRKIMARKCEIRRLTSSEAKAFFTENHLQGHTQAGYYLGLLHQDEIVQAVSIGQARFTKSVDIELHRLASKLNTTVIGGVDKLFAQVRQDFAGKLMVSYADKRYSEGAVYQRIGFDELPDSPPNYSWAKGQQILSRYQCQKHRLADFLGDKFDASKSEAQNMIGAGYLKISDCGNKVFRLQL